MYRLAIQKSSSLLVVKVRCRKESMLWQGGRIAQQVQTLTAQLCSRFC